MLPNDDSSNLRREAAFQALQPIWLKTRVFPSHQANSLAFSEFVAQVVMRTIPIRYLHFAAGSSDPSKSLSTLFTSEQSEFLAFECLDGSVLTLSHQQGEAVEAQHEPPVFSDPRVRLVTGWVQDTFPAFLVAEWRDKTTFLHFGAGTFPSSVFVLAALFSKLPKFFVLFDDFLMDGASTVYDYGSAFPVKIEFLGRTAEPLRLFGRLERAKITPRALPKQN